MSLRRLARRIAQRVAPEAVEAFELLEEFGAALDDGARVPLVIPERDGARDRAATDDASDGDTIVAEVFDEAGRLVGTTTARVTKR